MTDKNLRDTALKIVGLSDRGEVTLTGIEKVLAEFMARGRAAQQAADNAIVAAEQSMPTDRS